jgi:hypothetical protein
MMGEIMNSAITLVTRALWEDFEEKTNENRV